MRIVILTQDDPFYLGPNVEYLIKNLPPYSEIVSTVMFEVSPFGKKESFYSKMQRTYSVFGLSFFLHYGFKFIVNKFDNQTKINSILKKNNIPIVRLEKGVNHPDSLNIINSFYPDLLISIAGNQIFKKKLIDLAPKGCLNLHTALLPKYRGLMPSFWVLKNQEKETGVSVFYVDEGIDSGQILVQKRISISEEMTQSQLINVSKRIGMEAIIESISKIQKGDIATLPNPDAEKTYYTFPTKKDVREFKLAGKKFF
ncbi:methionyl-tRNA formyltransferase [Labilibaculum euxinus]